MYADGVGTPRDDKQAAAMFAKAALLGSPEAMANLGRMHAEGRGVPRDNAAAVAAFRAAARSGFQPAIVRMAEIYEKGELGVKPDPAQARAWRAQSSGRRMQSAPSASSAAQSPDAVNAGAAAPPEVASPVPRAPPAVAVARQPDQPQARQPQTAEAAPPSVPAPTQNVIESIVVTQQNSGILVRVRTKAALAAPPTDFMVATPPRIIFDFPHTVTGLGRFNEVGEGDLQSVDVIRGENRTRIVLNLRNSMQHDARVDQGGLLIRLTPMGRAGN